jgi:PPK2 family polyphosphate:nucleotide phosphotransferase
MKLANIDTRAPKKFNKQDTKNETVNLKARLEELQNLLYAESKHGLLVIVQGMDASGKDGAVKNVFNTINPLGCRVIPFKAPTTPELKHDFLWRIHKEVPERGMIHVFNRSHYEDVIIQRVHAWVDEKTFEERYEQINDFEKLLKQTGITVLKFYLHLSKDEQLTRLEERQNNPAKMWKFNANDLKEREYWDSYMDAYERAFKNCAEHAEWHIVPADQNWYKEFLIAEKIVETLEGFKMSYPGLKTD